MLEFGTIISEIKAYQQAMGYNPVVMTQEQKMQTLRDYAVALMMEQSELLSEVSWKPWRSIESQKPTPNRRKLALEWIDCLFFLVDQALMLDLSTDDLELAWSTKLSANHARIQSGYSTIRTDKTQNGENAK